MFLILRLGILLLACLSADALSQGANIRINTPDSDPEEVSIAINPTNPDNLIAGANLRYHFWSMDGGKTWGQAQLPSNTYGDPCVIFDADGRAYYAHLTVGWDAITVRTSDDGGKTWSAGVKLRGPSSDSARPGSLFRSSLQDKEWLVADMSTSPFRGTIYASWSDFTKYGSAHPEDSSVIVFARSTDRGDSFEPFVRVSDVAGDAIDSDNTMEGAVPAVGPDGEVYLGWSGPAGLYFDRSFDGGVTWGKDKILTATPGGWDFDIRGISRSNGLPVTVCDISSASTRGTVYINWIDQRNGDPDVFVIASTDKGTTWSTPIRVNDDAVRNGKEQFFTWATVDPVTGELSVVYYDRRRFNSDSTDVYLARSTDGGATFTNTRISTKIFLPSPGVFFGDYNCISAYNGRIRPIWVHLNNDSLSIHTALIDESSTGGDAPLEPSGLFLEPYPNPASLSGCPETTIAYATDRPGDIELSVFDVAGHHVATLVREWKAPGAYTVPFDAAALSPGSYLCRLTNGAASSSSARTAVLTLLR